MKTAKEYVQAAEADLQTAYTVEGGPEVAGFYLGRAPKRTRLSPWPRPRSTIPRAIYNGQGV